LPLGVLGFRHVDLLQGALPSVHLRLAAGQALLGSLLLAATGVALFRRRAQLVLALQVLALLQLGPLVATTELDSLSAPATWASRVGRGASVANSTLQSPFRDPVPGFIVPEPRLPSLALMAHELLETPTGVIAGLHYPLAPDLEGIYSPLSKRVQLAMPQLDLAGRLRWLGLLGAQYLVAAIPDPPPPGLRLVERRDLSSVSVGLFSLDEVLPAVWWPREITVVADLETALRSVTDGPDPRQRVVATRPVDQATDGQVRLLEASPDRIVLEVRGGGGLAVLQRAYQPLLVARSAGRRLETMPVDVALLGVVVPPGEHQVVLEVSSAAEQGAGVVAIAVLIAALTLAYLRRRAPTPASGEPPPELAR
jgi:hypothetical protein